MSDFINPYVFVPTTGTPHRTRAPGHLPLSSEDARYSGVIDVSWTLETPLLLPEAAKPEGWVLSDDRVRLPGSSLKGAVRSVHEAMFNGCFRVVDEGFVPGYRAPATSEAGWTLALVRESSAGVPTSLQLCDDEELVWVDAFQLARRYPQATPTTGDLVRVFGEVESTTLNRYEVREVDDVELISQVGIAEQLPSVHDSTGLEVFLATDTGARRPQRRNGGPGRCLWASAPLTSTLVTLDRDTTEGRAAWESFATSVSGSNDLRELLGAKDGPGANSQEARDRWRRGRVFADVEWSRKRVARRALHTGFLWPGDVVWVQTRERAVTGLKLSVIWREPGRGSVAERIGDHYPCLSRAGTDGLCPSCATFGAADTGGKRRGLGQQSAYAGHVRFGSATSDSPVTPRLVSLAPMGSPRPQNGAFYLDLAAPRDLGRPRGDLPTRWGGSADPNGNAAVRGRKFYWHANSDEQAARWSGPARYEATADQDKAGGGHRPRPAQLVPAGTILRSVVTVDALPLHHVQALLMALDPRRAASAAACTGRHALHLAGGKPLGLGSTTVSIRPRLTRSAQRYGSPDSREVESWDTSDGSVLEALSRAWGARLGDTLPDLLRVLDLDGLGEDSLLVSYPPGADWSSFGTQDFRLSYRFFGAANGQQLKGRSRPWRPLPALRRDAEMTIPIPRYDREG